MKVLSTERRKPRVQTVNEMESMTVQSDRHHADIKLILQRYEATGGLVDMRDVDLAYRDVTEFEDFVDVMRQGRVAEEAFMRLPSKVRELFDHDVFKWLDVAHDAEKLEALRPELERLGVIDAVAGPPPPVAVELVARNPDGTFRAADRAVETAEGPQE